MGSYIFHTIHTGQRQLHLLKMNSVNVLPVMLISLRINNEYLTCGDYTIHPVHT